MGRRKKERLFGRKPSDQVDLVAALFGLPQNRGGIGHKSSRAERADVLSYRHSPEDMSSSEDETIELNGPGERSTAISISRRPTEDEKTEFSVKKSSVQKKREKRKIKRPDTPPARTPSRRQTGNHVQRSSPKGVTSAAPAISLASTDLSTPVPSTLSVQPQSQLYYHPQFAFVPPVRVPQYFPVPVPPRVNPYIPQEVPMGHDTQLVGEHIKTRSAPTHSPGPFAQKLQKIQHAIQKQETLLARCPHDAAMKSSLIALQDQLNSTLNDAVAKEKLSCITDETNRDMGREYGKRFGQVEPLPNETRAKQGSKTERSSVSKQATMPPANNGPQETRYSYKKGTNHTESLETRVNHHLCSGCGVLRSTQFHNLHPFVTAQKPKLNFCGSCRRKKIKKGTADKYHFCFRCGLVRSKVFQEEHPIRAGETLLENYCTQCLGELRADEDLPDRSIAGSVS